MENFWSYGSDAVIEYEFSNKIERNSYSEIVNSINNIFINLFDKYKFYMLADLIKPYKDINESSAWVSSNKASNIVRCFNWNNWMIENNHISIPELNQIKLFQLFYYKNNELVRSEFDIQEWELLLNKLPFPNHRFKNLTGWYSDMVNLPIDFRSSSYNLETIAAKEKLDVYISLTSIYNLWFPKVIYYPQDDAVEKDNYLIALYNASRFNSILKELIPKLGELGFTYYCMITKINEEFVTRDGILINNKITYWEDVMSDALSIPLVEFRDNDLNQEAI